MKSEIYVSTGEHYLRPIQETVCLFRNSGFEHLELSCGKVVESDLSFLKDCVRQGTKLRLHNYFPAFGPDFTLNLASKDKDIRHRSRGLIFDAINWSNELGSDFYAFHAGFFLDVPPQELGKTLSSQSLFCRREAQKIFFEELSIVVDRASEMGVEIAVENNVIGQKNKRVFGENNPLMFCGDTEVCLELPDRIGVLLDFGHLKVSARSLKFDLLGAYEKLKDRIVAYHYSDNEGFEDTNSPIKTDSWFMELALKKELHHTVEVYGSHMPELQHCVRLLQEKLNGE